LWGNESILDTVKLKLTCEKSLLSFSSPGSWPCNFFPLQFQWLKKNSSITAYESMLETWTLIFGRNGKKKSEESMAKT
jgi:hypothetical protein